MARQTRRRAFALAGALILLAAAGAAPAGARLGSGPTVEVQTSAGLVPDGQSMRVSVVASCPERSTVVEAAISVSQPHAFGQTSFPLRCDGGQAVYHVAVPSSGGTFDLGEARVDASVVVRRGKTASASDSEVVDPQPLVFVVLAETAKLQSGGGAVVIDLTVACPVGTTGLESRAGISQGNVSGSGTYTPVCDGSSHTFSVTVPGAFQPGSALSLTFADIEHEGQVFSGVDEGPIEIVA